MNMRYWPINSCFHMHDYTLFPINSSIEQHDMAKIARMSALEILQYPAFTFIKHVALLTDLHSIFLTSSISPGTFLKTIFCKASILTQIWNGIIQPRNSRSLIAGRTCLIFFEIRVLYFVCSSTDFDAFSVSFMN